MKPFKDILNNSFLNYIILFITLLYSLVFIYFGIDFTDTFYYINLCKDYTSSPMIMLTLLIGKVWMLLFGDSLISFRVLNWAIWILSVLLPFFLLIPSNSRRGNLKYLSISIFLITILNSNVFGGDICTLLFLALSASLVIKYYRTNRLMYLLLYGFSSSLLILVRLPNILILPASAVLISIIEYSQNFQKLPKKNILISCIKKLCIYLAVSIGFYVLIILIVFGSLSEFTSNVSLSIMSLDKSHTLVSMVRVYIRDFVKIFQYMGVCFIIFTLLNNKLNFNLLIKNILALSACVLLILFLKVEIGIGKYNWNISLFYSAIVCSIIICSSILYIKNKEYSGLVFLSVIVILAIIPIIGSNTGLLNLSSFLIVILPVLPTSNQNIINKIPHIGYLVVIFFLFVIYTKMMVVYEDSKIVDLKYELTNDKINHIRTTKSNVEFINNVLQEFKKIETENKPVLFYGKVSHIFYYLTTAKPLYQNSFWMPPYDLIEVKKAEQIIISKRPVVIFMPSYPGNSYQYLSERKAISPFESMLVKKGYIGSSENGFIVYNP